MKGLIVSISVVMIATFLGCGCVHRSGEQQDAEQTEAVKKPAKKKTTVVYSSAIAAGRPVFEDDTTSEGPLKMSDSRKTHGHFPEDIVDVADVGMYSWIDRREPPLKSGNLRQFYVDITNDSRDTLVIDTILVPDSRFEVDWEGGYRFYPDHNSGMRCYLADSTDVIEEVIKDYRLVVVYGNKNIPPQTLHFNIHPDINKLRADYAASHQE